MTSALTITTGQVENWGLVGGAIIVIAALLVIRLVRSLVGRLVWTLAALVLLAGLWAQRGEIEHSVAACDPHVLGIHLQISNSAARAKCAHIFSGVG